MQRTNRNCTLFISDSPNSSKSAQDNNEELLVVLSGEIDHHSAVWVRSEIDARILKDKPKKTVIDLSGISFMDSSGIGLIMGRHVRMQEVGGRLSVREPNERIVKIFELAGLTRIVSIERSGKKRRGRV